jgi:hypothetical protein
MPTQKKKPSKVKRVKMWAIFDCDRQRPVNAPIVGKLLFATRELANDYKERNIIIRDYCIKHVLITPL